jgi:hypothetical protein
MIGIGWTLDAVNFFGGLLRMLFPFTLGMLMARNFNKTTRPQDHKTTSQSAVPEPVKGKRFDKLSDQTNSQQSTANGLSIGSFFKRRLIRLHPMVVMGAVIGLITYHIQGGVQWDGTQVSFHWVMIAFFLGMCLIPIHPGAPYDVRGNGEMYPLNGPSWSLFFEYVGNILYALFTYKGKTYKKILGIEEGVKWNECFVSPEVIKEGKFSVSVYCDNLITTNSVDIPVLKSGYTDNIVNQEATPSMTEQMNTLMYKYASLCNQMYKECEKIKKEMEVKRNG